MASWPPVGEQWGAGPHLTFLSTQFRTPFLAPFPKETRLDPLPGPASWASTHAVTQDPTLGFNALLLTS